ncbi:MAG: MarR family winged helix-turn-helix transcriptional regulator [Pseudomonadota bacterium]
MQTLPPLPPVPTLQRLLAVLLQFRAIDPEFPLQYAICLCEIAQNPGMSLTNLSEKTSLALSTVSRIVGALSDYRPNGAPYGLISMEIAAVERRRRELKLTAAGVELLRAACTPLGSDGTEQSDRTISLKTVW